MLSRSSWHKAYIAMLNPDEVHKCVPYMNMDDVIGGLLTPGNLEEKMNNDVALDMSGLTHVWLS